MSSPCHRPSARRCSAHDAASCWSVRVGALTSLAPLNGHKQPATPIARSGLRRQATEELQRLLTLEAAAFPALNWLRLSLETRGKLLCPDDEAFAWGLLPLLVVEAAGGDPDAAVPLAAATECLIAASDVLDDVEDGDSASGLERTCGVPTAINVGLFLTCLAQLAVYRLGDLGTEAQLVRDVGRVLVTAGARACSGQQQDIDQDDALLTEAGYLAMVQAKSGALVEGVCRAAALLAGASPTATDGYARFGRNLGMALQVSNDVRAISAGVDHRNDLTIAKRTLPLAFALQQAPQAVQPLATSARATRLTPRQAQRLGELLQTSGGVLYASVVADTFFEDASACLDDAGCAQTSRLRAYLMALRHE